MKRVVALIISVALCLPLWGCESLFSQREYSADFFAMDTYMTITAYGKHATEAVDAAVEEIEGLEQLLSTNIPTSEVAMLNKTGSGDVSYATAVLIQKSLEYYKETNGVYDITVYPCVYEWGFTTKNFVVPPEERIEELLPLVGSDKLHCDSVSNDDDIEKKYHVTFDKEGMMIDLGTIAKGYASQRAAEILEDYGVQSGIINLGGNVQLVGTKPDGADWRVAIQKPDKDAEDTAYIGTVSARNCAITTAGGYERYFEEDGVIYRHIFDPATGCPTESSLKSVSVVAQSGIDADGYDTALFAMDLDEAITFWKEHKDDFDVIIVTEDDKIYVSSGIFDSFEVSDTSYEVVEIP